MFEIDVPPHLHNVRSCLMPICGCIDAMHGRAFRHLVAATAEKFRSVRLILCDTLDAHNFATKDAPLWPDAVDACVADAARWLRKSLPVLEGAFDHVSVTRWEELKTAEYGQISQRVRDLYDRQPVVRDYIHSICADYTDRAATRQESKGFLPDRDRIFMRPLNYTLEEIPGTVIYHRLFRAPVIYVGAYFDDPQFFNRHARHEGGLDSTDMNLELPEWCRVRLSGSPHKIAA